MALKELESFARQNGMVWDPVRQAAYGRFHGFETVVSAENRGREYRINLGASATQPDTALIQSLRGLTQGRPYLIAASYANHTITLGLRQQRGRDCENLTQVLQAVAETCQAQSVRPCCRYCGAQAAVSPYGIDGQVDYLCPACADQLTRSGRGAAKKKFGNLWTGLLGALLGSLLGVALWVVIYELGFIAGLAGLAMLLFAVKGFQLLGGTLNRGSALLCIFISLFMVLVAENVTVYIEVFKALRESYPGLLPTDLSFTGVIQTAWATPELRTGILVDLAMGYILYLVAGVSYMRQLFHSSQTSREFIRLDTAVL